MASHNRQEREQAQERGSQAHAQADPETAPANGERRWVKVERKRARFWAPAPGAVLVTRIGNRVTKDTKFGTRTHYESVAEDATTDLKGAISSGERINIRAFVTLDNLADLRPGTLVRITMVKLDGMVKVFDVERAG